MEIKITVRTVDHHHESRRFRTLAGARRFAQRWVGRHPDTESGYYAVSAYGDVRVDWDGCLDSDLWPADIEPMAVAHGSECQCDDCYPYDFAGCGCDLCAGEKAPPDDGLLF